MLGTSFAHPLVLSVIAAPALLVSAYVVVQIRRRRRLTRYADAALLGSVRPRRPRPWRHVPIVLLLAAMVPLTIAAAGPMHDVRIPRNRAMILLAIDVSPSMRATDVDPDRLDAAVAAAKRFAGQLTPGVNLGLIQFSGSPEVLVPPTSDHQATVEALDHLSTGESTAIGAAMFAALQSVREVAAIISDDQDPPPASIVVLSDGKETKPSNPNAPQGAYTAARAAKDQGVTVSTISFGTSRGTIQMDGSAVPVPVDDSTLKQVAQLSGGRWYAAQTADDLDRSYAHVAEQIGYQSLTAPDGTPWLRWGMLAVTVAVAAGLLMNRRVPV